MIAPNLISLNWPWIWLLLPLPLLFLMRTRNTRKPSEALAIPPQLANALDRQRSGERRTKFWSIIRNWLCWLLLLGAISQPFLTLGSTVHPATGRAIMMAIDLSGSMEKRDFVLDGEKVNRLTAVKAMAIQFVQSRRGDRVGLVVYADEAFAASPLTFDMSALSSAIAETGIGMVGRTTAIGDALGLATVKLRDDPAKEKAVILLSDGTNNSGSTEPEDAAALAKEFGVRVHTIALTGAAENSTGTMDPAADLDTKTLQAVADAAGGRFFQATTSEALQQVYQAVGALETSETDSPPLAARRDLRNILTLCLLALLVLPVLWQWVRR